MAHYFDCKTNTASDPVKAEDKILRQQEENPESLTLVIIENIRGLEGINLVFKIRETIEPDNISIGAVKQVSVHASSEEFAEKQAATKKNI